MSKQADLSSSQKQALLNCEEKQWRRGRLGSHGASSFDMFHDVRGRGFKALALVRRGLIEASGEAHGGGTLYQLTELGSDAIKTHRAEEGSQA